jgi:LPXTG-site transpeptidase (sortase) family protein
VPQLGIDLPVVAGDGYNAPLYKAATYPSLKLPGQGGRSMLYGHARPGMFAPLFNAAVGQDVDVAYPDGRVLRYRITEFYPRWPIADTKWLQPATGEELILLTCTTYEYNDPRVVAVARPR